MTTRGHVFLGAGVSVAIAGIVLGLHDLTKVGALLIGLPLLAALFARRSLTIEVTRAIVPGRVTADEHADVTVSVHNRGRRTTPLLRGEEGLAHALGDRPHLLIPRLERGETRQLTYRVRSHVRGHHPVGPLTLRVNDPFGLATRVVTVPGENVLVVLPRVLSLIRARGVTSAGGGQISSARMALHGEDDIGVREYRIGDDLRRIHWRSTARTGETMVRQDEPPARRRALVLLDDRAVVHAGIGEDGSFEWSITAAASIVTVLLGERFEVHLRLASDEAGRVAPVDGLDRALDELAAVQPAPTTSARGIVESLEGFARHGGGLVVGILGALEPEITDLCTMRTGHALAFVIDRGGFHDRVDEDGPAEASSHRLAIVGWRTQVVRPGDELPRLWAELTVGMGVRS